MNPEQLILDAVERGKALGYAEGMKAMRVKQLTDEEIEDFIAIFPIIFTPDDLVTFARALLRKASEK